ncbi:calcium-transporting ATPase 9, plasma membrane-type-like [Arachis hypogaea]|uniref:calcium-transporting ATPase 9, plasma membrane-type-like n=1 Tax=Arachis hypogaea TaxID=3818 RepID=UPI0034E73CA9|nr:Calcium-transporting ATPase 9, plasma membrane-type [Arachis hypogaea]
MWRNLIIQAIYQVTILLILNFGWQSMNLGDDQYFKSHSLQVKNTLIFNTFILCQIFNEFNARKIDQMNVFKGVTKNRLFMEIVGVTFVLQFNHNISDNIGGTGGHVLCTIDMPNLKCLYFSFFKIFNV